MSTYDKLLARLLTLPTDFTEAELFKLFNHLGYVRDNGSGGSGIKYIRKSDGSMINFHLPHNGEKHLPRYVLKQVIEELKKRGEI